MFKFTLIVVAAMLVAGCDRANPNRDLISLSEEDASYRPLPPLTLPEPGAPLPEPQYERTR